MVSTSISPPMEYPSATRQKAFASLESGWESTSQEHARHNIFRLKNVLRPIQNATHISLVRLIETEVDNKCIVSESVRWFDLKLHVRMKYSSPRTSMNPRSAGCIEFPSRSRTHRMTIFLPPDKDTVLAKSIFTRSGVDTTSSNNWVGGSQHSVPNTEPIDGFVDTCTTDKSRSPYSSQSSMSRNDFLIASGRIHSSIVLGRYFSTHRYCLSVSTVIRWVRIQSDVVSQSRVSHWTNNNTNNDTNIVVTNSNLRFSDWDRTWSRTPSCAGHSRSTEYVLLVGSSLLSAELNTITSNWIHRSNRPRTLDAFEEPR